MILKFNNGKGALVCENCNIIVMQDFHSYEWRTLNNLNDRKYKWLCNQCDTSVQLKQNLDYIDEVNKYADEFALQRRQELRRRFEVF